MTNVLARIRVHEPHGIRRFLYPLTAALSLPPDLKDVTVVTADGLPIPSQLTQISVEEYRLDFAVSLAPDETAEYQLVPGIGTIVNDPLQIQPQEPGVLLHSRQQRFEIALGDDAQINRVGYDGVSHLRDNLRIERTDMGWDEPCVAVFGPRSEATLCAWARTTAHYDDGIKGITHVVITACKSWASVWHILSRTEASEEIVFTLPFAVSSPILTYDLGVEGVYGKLERQKGDSVSWRMTRGDKNIDWEVALNGRQDYTGRMTQAEFGYKRWLHLVDGDKAVAVAVTHLPTQWREIEARLTSHGDIQVIFRTGPQVEQAAIFGVCYHFLNDVPAIAAATNPQSILLPPTVEVLPL